MQWIGDPEMPLTPTFIDDVAATLAAVGTRDASAAKVWHVPQPSVTTGRALAAEACRQAGTELRLVRYESAPVRGCSGGADQAVGLPSFDSPRSSSPLSCA